MAIPLLMPRSVVRAAVLAVGCACAGVAVAQQVIDETLSRFVFRNDRTVVWFSFQVDGQCKVIRGFNLAVVRPPRHGRVALGKVDRIIDRTFFSFRLTPAEAAIVTRCQGRTVPVLQASYTSEKDFTGFDDMLIVVTSPDRSSQRRVEMKIGVR